MVAEIEAVGDALTGALVSRVVEPDTNEGRGAATSACLNCDAPLVGNHCHHCGQKGRVHRTLSAFGHDIAHSVLHFDGKIWRTLPLLAWYPGELTRRYVHGERAKFVSPIALFLFTVFLSFAVFRALVPSEIDFNSKPMTAAEAAKSLASDRAEIVKDIKELETERNQALADKEPVGWMDSELTRNRAMLNRLDTKQAPEVRQKEITERRFALERAKQETEITRLTAKISAARKADQPTKALEDELDSARMTIKLMETATDVMQNGGEANWNLNNLHLSGNAALIAAAKNAVKNPQLLIYKIQSNAYKFSWALIPISVPFVWLLFFWRRDFKLFDHAVFVTYSLCFMLTFAMVCAIILTLTAEGSFLFVATVLALIFFPPIHMYRQLHRAYQTTRGGAVWRTIALTQFALLALVLFSAGILALGVAG